MKRLSLVSQIKIISLGCVVAFQGHQTQASQTLSNPTEYFGNSNIPQASWSSTLSSGLSTGASAIKSGLQSAWSGAPSRSDISQTYQNMSSGQRAALGTAVGTTVAAGTYGSYYYGLKWNLEKLSDRYTRLIGYFYNCDNKVAPCGQPKWHAEPSNEIEFLKTLIALGSAPGQYAELLSPADQTKHVTQAMNNLEQAINSLSAGSWITLGTQVRKDAATLKEQLVELKKRINAYFYWKALGNIDILKGQFTTNIQAQQKKLEANIEMLKHKHEEEIKKYQEQAQRLIERMETLKKENDALKKQASTAQPRATPNPSASSGGLVW